MYGYICSYVAIASYVATYIRYTVYIQYSHQIHHVITMHVASYACSSLCSYSYHVSQLAIMYSIYKPKLTGKKTFFPSAASVRVVATLVPPIDDTELAVRVRQPSLVCVHANVKKMSYI